MASLFSEDEQKPEQSTSVQVVQKDQETTEPNVQTMTKDEFNFYRLYKGCINVVAEALRDVFITEWNKKFEDSKWQGTTASSYEYASKAREIAKRKKLRINEHELHKMETNPIDKWDITRLSSALTGICDVLGVNGRPDSTLKNAIISLKKIRDDAYAHVPICTCSDEDYDAITEVVMDCIQELSCSINVDKYKNKLNESFSMQRLNDQESQYKKMKDELLLEKQKRENAEKERNLAEQEKNLAERQVKKEKENAMGIKMKLRKYAVFTTVLVILAMLGLMLFMYNQSDIPDKTLLLPLPPPYFSGRHIEIASTVDKILRSSYNYYGKWQSLKYLITYIFQFDKSSNASNDKRVYLFSGSPGFGKTSLALMIGHEMKNKHGFDVVFINLRHKTNIEDLIERVVTELKGTQISTSEATFITFIRSTIKRKTIIILDNLEDLLAESSELERFNMLIENVLENTTNVIFLCTSRTSFYLHLYRVENMAIANLSLSDATAALQKMSTSFSYQEANELSLLCGGVPMVIAIYGAQVDGLNLEPRVIIEKIKREGIIVAFDPAGVPYTRNIIKLIDKSFDLMEDSTTEVFLALTHFPISFTRTAAEYVLKQAENEIDRLVKSNLVNVYSGFSSNERFTIHPLLQEYGQVKLCNKTEQLEFLCNQTLRAFHQLNIEIMSRIAKTFFSNHSQKCLQEIYDENSNLRKTFESIYQYPDMYERYYNMIVQTSDLLLYGLDDVSFARYIEKAANYSRTKGDYKRHLALLYLEGDRGDTYFYLRKTNFIDTLLKVETTYMANESLCGDHDVTREYAMCLCSRGRAFALYASVKHWSETANRLVNVTKGVDLIQNAIEVFNSLNLRYESANAFSLLGLIHKNWNDFKLATDFYFKSLQVFEKDYGDNAFTAAAHFNLGYVYMRRGPAYRQSAVDSFTQSFKIYNATIGTHRRTAYAAAHAAEVLRKLERYKEAIQMLNHAFNMQKEIMYNSRDTVETLGELAENYKGLDRYQDAIMYSQKSLRLMLTPGVMSSLKHRETGCMYKFVGECLRHVGDIKQAADRFQEALVIFEYVCAEHGRECDQIEKTRKTLADLQIEIASKTFNINELFISIVDNVSCLFTHYYQLFLTKLDNFVDAL